MKRHVHDYFDTKASFDSDFYEEESQTEYIMNITLEKYKQLVPTSIRTKRGLLNPLGSLIKTITGNLDHDDAEMYEKLISTLNTKQDKIAQKMTIVAEMVGSFTNISNATRNNFIQINKSLNDINRSINASHSFQTGIKITHIYNILTNNFQTIYARLNEIETAVAFARIKLLHQSIIDTNELMVLLQEIEKTEKLVYPVNIENLLKIEQCIEMKAYLKQNQIKFIMHIPLIRNEIFNYFKMIPLPVYDSNNGLTSLILPKYPYLLVKGLNTKPLSQPCREIDDVRFLCFENDVTPLVEDNCITELMRFSTNISSCHPVPVTIDDFKVNLIQPNRWIVYAKTEILLTKYCENEIMQESIYGTYLLSMDDNDDCQVKIKDLTLKTHHTQGKSVTYTKFPVMSLPKISPNSSDVQKKPVDLNGVDLADIQRLTYLWKKSESASDNSVYSDTRVFSEKSAIIGNIVFYVIIVICIVLLACKNRIRKFCKTRDNPHPSDNLEVMEGGVIPLGPPGRPVFLAM